MQREAFNLGLIDAEALARALSVRNVKAAREPGGRRIGAGELCAILARLALDRPAGKRDAALIALANPQDRGADFELRLVGNGNRERLLFVNNGAARCRAERKAARKPAA